MLGYLFPKGYGGLFMPINCDTITPNTSIQFKKEKK
jgi:hypothetical protein